MLVWFLDDKLVTRNPTQNLVKSEVIARVEVDTIRQEVCQQQGEYILFTREQIEVVFVEQTR